MTFKFEQDIQFVLDEHKIRFKAESLRDFSRVERLSILIKSFRAVNVVDGFLLFLAISIILEAQIVLTWFVLLAAGVAGFSAWRLWNYYSAANKLKKLYKDAI